MPEIERDKVLFGKYELGKLLGCGAFAKVYHARDVRNGQSHAIKVINKKRIVGSALMSNVKREISIMRQLHHPNIVKLFELLATKTKIYFVLEFVKGGELFSKVAKGRFSEDLSRRYFQQLISAVGYCHSRGVFHRDLKPENLLVDENGDLKVTDFGLSAVMDQVRNDGLLHTLCGTPAYVAPDILTKKGYDGAKVDVWSCGIILYVMVAGYLPFNDPNLMAMYKKIYRGDFRCPKWISADLKRFLSRLLDTKPLTRITIHEILSYSWFKKGYKEIHPFPFYQEEEEDKIIITDTNHQDNKPSSSASSSSSCCLNAFDIISFSSGLDLSGLFLHCSNSSNAVDETERFVSAESPRHIIQKLEEVAKEDNLRIVKRKKKEWAVELGGQNGNFSLTVEVCRLTKNLVVADVRSRGVDANETWMNKLRLELRRFVYQQQEAQISVN